VTELLQRNLKFSTIEEGPQPTTSGPARACCSDSVKLRISPADLKAAIRERQLLSASRR